MSEGEGNVRNGHVHLRPGCDGSEITRAGRIASLSPSRQSGVRLETTVDTDQAGCMRSLNMLTSARVENPLPTVRSCLQANGLDYTNLSLR